jgi:hypothetical protein
MDDLLINKIAPLCPFLYLTLRLVCKKYWKALDKKNIESFGRILFLYLQKDNLYEKYTLLKHEEQIFFIKSVEPKFSDHYIIPISAKPRGYPKEIVFYVPATQYMYYSRIYCEMIGRKNHQDFAEYVCQNMCQLKCCGNTWYNYLTSLRKEWMLSYDSIDKVFILECFFLFFFSFFF